MPLNLMHLIERAKDCEPGADVSTPEKVIAAFDARIDSIDFAEAAMDVRGYLMEGGEIDIDIWNRDFFHQMVRKITFK